MTHDTIITAEILESLTKCPFCKANQTRIQFGDWATYACLSSFHVEQKASRCRSILCEQRELAALRARVKELEEVLTKIELAMKQPASNHRLMQIAGPARQVINIIKKAKEEKS